MKDDSEISQFIKWMALKRNVNNNEKHHPMYKENEVWWVAIGKNIGIEMNGKSNKFSRPVLIFKKLSPEGFMGIPLTSQKHLGSWYTKFVFQEKINTPN